MKEHRNRKEPRRYIFSLGNTTHTFYAVNKYNFMTVSQVSALQQHTARQTSVIKKGTYLQKYAHSSTLFAYFDADSDTKDVSQSSPLPSR